MAGELLVSTAVMGGAIIAVTMWVTLSPRWTGSPVRTTLAGATERTDHEAESGVGRPVVWTLAFAAMVVGIVVVMVGFETASLGVSPTVALIGGMGTLLVAYLVYGIYVAAASRGHPRSVAAGEAATVAGALFLVAIVAQLFGV